MQACAITEPRGGRLCAERGSNGIGGWEVKHDEERRTRRRTRRRRRRSGIERLLVASLGGCQGESHGRVNVICGLAHTHPSSQHSKLVGLYCAHREPDWALLSALRSPGRRAVQLSRRFRGRSDTRGETDGPVREAQRGKRLACTSDNVTVGWHVG